MAFFGKLGNILRQSTSPQISTEFSSSKPSLFQAIRCMSTKLFIGGLSYNTDEQGLREAFAKYGEVLEAKVIVDRETGNSRGFGFVSFNTTEEASSAIQALSGQDLHGRQIRVDFATERAPRSYGGGGYGGYQGGGGGGYQGGGGYGGGGYQGGGGYGGGGGGYQGGGGYGGGVGYQGGGGYGGGGYQGGGGGYGGYQGGGGGGGNGGYQGGDGGNYSNNFASGGEAGLNDEPQDDFAKGA